MNAQFLELHPEVAQRLVEFFLARHFARESELPTDLRFLLVERDGVSTLSCCDCACKPGRTGADDAYP